MHAPSETSLYDRIHNADSRSIANCSMKILNTLQNTPADQQLLATSVVFLSVAERYNLSPSDLLNAVDNLRRYSKRYDKATFGAITDYFKNETY